MSNKISTDEVKVFLQVLDRFESTNYDRARRQFMQLQTDAPIMCHSSRGVRAGVKPFPISTA